MLKELESFAPGELEELRAKQEKLRASKASASCGWVIRHTDNIVKAVAEHVFDLREAVQDLEARLNIAEAKGMRYQGVYSKADQYQPGDVATHRGTLWYCEKQTRSTPGGGPASGWRLMAKTQQGAK